MDHNRADIAYEIMKSSPPAALTGVVLFGYTLNEWVAIATLGYIALQAVVLISREVPVWSKRWKQWRKSKRDAKEQRP